VRSWRSIREAARVLVEEGKSTSEKSIRTGISHVLSGDLQTAYGYEWARINETN
jgi:hypothetical protein